MTFGRLPNSQCSPRLDILCESNDSAADVSAVIFHVIGRWLIRLACRNAVVDSIHFSTIRILPSASSMFLNDSQFAPRNLSNGPLPRDLTQASLHSLYDICSAITSSPTMSANYRLSISMQEFCRNISQTVFAAPINNTVNAFHPSFD